MFFIFSWGRKVNKAHGIVTITKCNGCLSATEWVLIEQKTVASIFFIPIISYDNRYFLVCNGCGKEAFEIFDKQITSAKEMVKLFKGYKNGRLSKEEMDEAIKINRFVPGIEDPNSTWECPNCGKENVNTNYKCKSCDYRLV